MDCLSAANYEYRKVSQAQSSLVKVFEALKLLDFIFNRKKHAELHSQRLMLAKEALIVLNMLFQIRRTDFIPVPYLYFAVEVLW